MAQKLMQKREFPDELKVELFQLREKLNEINANTFVPLVLFNRDETVRLIRESKKDLERLVKMV
ncbi:MAG: hypothetical protein DRN81_02020 [Thermoproteota archaeon]|nr:MAG: hypothetical protein DRN81_02020 [Candidatus Korarchaeota archaeon]